jgi:PTH1 family peptidyl-tRNA hydrolase
LYVIVGLGNPGPSYQYTRHNIGFMVLDLWQKRLDLKYTRDVGPSQVSFGNILKNKIIFVRPLTFMNLSGRAVKRIIDKYQISDFSKLLVISDDLNLPFGSIRLRGEGSSGGQKGLHSIISELGTSEFPRIRIGIGPGYADAVKYVLSPFSKKEKKDLNLILEMTVEAVEAFMTSNLEKTMSQYNKNYLDI